MGLLHGQGISAKFNGDSSLQKRPMNRIMLPLKKMGATFDISNGGLPINMHSLNNRSIEYNEKTKSAQVKTSLIFAGLGSNKSSSISYSKICISRNIAHDFIRSISIVKKLEKIEKYRMCD